MRTLLAFLWKYAFGVLLCLTPITAIIVLGWTGRAMRRSAVKVWFRHSGNEASSFATAMSASPETVHLGKWPNWILGQASQKGEADAPTSGFRKFVHRCFGSLWENFTLGLQMALNCWVITIPACLLWLLGWWAGWENSFNKGYEQAWVGPVTVLAGAVLFIAAMFHLPLAQARQAVTGRWRSFYDFRLMHGVRRLGRLSAVWLVILYLAAGLLVAGAKIAPLGIGNYFQSLSVPLTDEQAELVRFGWAVTAAGLVFTLFVGLRLVAARQYARNIASGLSNGRLDSAALAENERLFAERFGLAEGARPEKRNIVLRSMAASGTGMAAITAAVLIAVGWGAFSFQILFAQFLNHSWVAWLNLALIQLPWLK